MTEQDSTENPRDRALKALQGSGIDFTITEHGPVKSLEEAAEARGVSPSEIVKSMVVRSRSGRSLRTAQ